MSAHPLPPDEAGAFPAPGAKASPPVVIGEGMRIAGKLFCDAHIQIDGMVEGDIRARSITIGAAGTVVGTLAAEDVLVRGAVNGTVTARSVTLASGSNMTGDLVQESICIERGAVFNGACRRPATAEPPRPPARRSALLAAPTVDAAEAEAAKEPVPAK